MKKIKLITPILGIATISSSLIPLTSCNNNGGKQEQGMSKEQWNKAFASIKNPWDTNRNFTVEGYEYRYSEGKEVKKQEWSAKACGKFNEGSIGMNDIDSYNSCIIDDIIWIKDSKGNLSPCISNLGLDGTMIEAFIGFGEIFDDMFNSKTYQGDNKYQSTWLNIGYLKGISNLVFDNDLKITSIDTRLHYGEEIKDSNLIIGAKLNFKDYGSTTVTVKESDFTDTKNQIMTATSSGSTYQISIVKELAQKSCLYCFNMPADLSITGLNNITLTSNIFYELPTVVLNGQTLIPDVDFDWDDDRIILATPLTKNDKLMINARLQTVADTTMTLAKGA